ncbi:extracellular solute-binding protein [Pelagibacterium montanilacus]|uniref:extracellular solute-binding protein n=1 Tax=Pelagibacterium montanilacus TaxID=2185280 RepID=UPI0013E0AF82|nr:extracellular solute-binding protein [Pelagibacterium montanilacus]
MDYLIALADRYAEDYGTDAAIELVTTPDLPVKLSSAFIARRSVGDAVFVDAVQIAGLAENGWLTDLTDLVENEFVPAGMLRNSLTAATYNDRIYGVPVTIGAPIMHWNKDLLEGAGLDPEAPAGWHSTPNSWNEFVDYAKAITNSDDNVYGLVDNWGGTGSIFTFGSLLQMHGGHFLDDDRNPVMNSEEGVEALSRMVELLHEHRAIDPASVTYTWVFDASPSYLAGTRGFFFTWPFIAGIANGSEDSQIQGRSGYAPNPSVVTSASVDGSEYLTVPTFSDNPEGGRQFIEMAVALENQILQGSETAWAPVLEPALSEQSVLDNLPVAEVIRQSYEYPVDGGYSADRLRWVEILTGELSQAFAQSKDPRTALNDAVSQIEQSRT